MINCFRFVTLDNDKFKPILSVFLLILKTILLIVSTVEKVSKNWGKENCAVKLIMDSDDPLDTSSIDTLAIVRNGRCKLFKFYYLLSYIMT